MSPSSFHPLTAVKLVEGLLRIFFGGIPAISSDQMAEFLWFRDAVVSERGKVLFGLVVGGRIPRQNPLAKERGSRP